MSDASWRVLVADGHTLYGQALRAGLDADDRFAVVGVSTTADGLSHSVATMRPDIAVVATHLPVIGGIAACTQLKDAASPPATMVLDDRPRPQALIDAIDARADGYITRDVSMRGFLEALDAVGRGEVSVPRSMQATLVRELRRARLEHSRAARLFQRLTPREREVLELLADGLEYDSVADVLTISPQTVRTHVQNVMAKLHVHSRLEAAAIARRYRKFVDRSSAA